jgi:hypothetical protein
MKGKSAGVDVVAATLVGCIRKSTDIIYTSGIWCIIMGIIFLIPERIFKKIDILY